VDDDGIPPRANALRDYYLKKAAEAGEKAASTSDPLLQASWLRVADSWRELAEGASEKSRL